MLLCFVLSFSTGFSRRIWNLDRRKEEMRSQTEAITKAGSGRGRKGRRKLVWLEWWKSRSERQAAMICSSLNPYTPDSVLAARGT